MPFTAIYGNQRIISSAMSPSAWRSLKRDEKRKNQLFCPDPDCGQLMIPKTFTRTGTQFFAHKSAPTLKCYFKNKKSPEHYHYQDIVEEVIQASGWEASKEHYVPADAESAKAWVDVLAIPPASVKHSPIAFEIQLSPQSDAIYEKRTERYSRAGFQTVWLTGKEIVADVCSAVLVPELPIEEQIGFTSNSNSARLIEIVHNSLPPELSSRGQMNRIALTSFVQYLFDNDVWWDRCSFLDRMHWCSFDCAMEAGECQHEERTQEIQLLMGNLIKNLSRWASKVKLENHLWKVLNHIAEKENLSDIKHVLEKKYLESKLSLFGDGKFIFNKSYPPARLPDLCLWLWESENLRKKIFRSPAYDPRLDYEFWLCDCDYKHLEIGYRIFNEHTPRMTRVSVIRCTKCGRMNSGAGPHKSRIKTHLLNTAKRYELYRKGNHDLGRLKIY